MNKPRQESRPTRFALVTGGGAGIGRAVCRRLSEVGWAVAVADIDPAAAEETAGRLGPEAIACPLDVSDAGQWHDLVERLRDRWPRIDLLVNNAGVLTGGELAHAGVDDLRRTVDVNLTGVLIGCRSFGPWLIESASRERPGSSLSPRAGVINTASIFAPLAPPAFAAYSATKAGVVGLSTALRAELAPHGLNVTVTLPGAVATGLFDRASFTSADFSAAATRFIERGALTPEQVADATLRAASRGRARVVIGGRARRFAWLARVAPRLTDWLVARRACEELGLPLPAPSKEESLEAEVAAGAPPAHESE